MMIDSDNLSETLRELLTGTVCFLGIGNTDRADDGAGVVLARLLIQRGMTCVFEAGATPERLVPALRDSYETIVFLDAVDAGLEPGSVIILDAQQIKNRFPQVSTHKLALSTLAGLISEGTTGSIWLIGIQAQTIECGRAILSPEVDLTLHALAGRIAEAMERPVRAHRERLCI